MSGNHRVDWISTFPFSRFIEYFPNAREVKGHPATKGDIHIGNDVWIARGVTILSGVTIGDGAVLAVDAVITKDVGSYEVWGGNPARLLKRRFTDAEIAYLLALKWWDLPHEQILQLIPALCNSDVGAIQEKIRLMGES